MPRVSSDVIIVPSIIPELFARPNWQMGNRANIHSLLKQAMSDFTCVKIKPIQPECDTLGQIRWQNLWGYLDQNKYLSNTLFSLWSTFRVKKKRTVNSIALLTDNNSMTSSLLAFNETLDQMKIFGMKLASYGSWAPRTSPTDAQISLMAEGIVKSGANALVLVGLTTDRTIYSRVMHELNVTHQYNLVAAAAPGGTLPLLRTDSVNTELQGSFGVLQFSETLAGPDYSSFDTPEYMELFPATSEKSSTEVFVDAAIAQYTFLVSTGLQVVSIGATVVVALVRGMQRDPAYPQTALSNGLAMIRMTGPSHRGNLAFDPSVHIVRFTGNTVCQMNEKNEFDIILPITSKGAVSSVEQIPSWSERYMFLNVDLTKTTEYIVVGVCLLALTSWFNLMFVEQVTYVSTRYRKQSHSEVSSVTNNAPGRDVVTIKTLVLWIILSGFVQGIGYWMSMVWGLMSIRFTNMKSQFSEIVFDNTYIYLSGVLMTMGSVTVSFLIVWATYKTLGVHTRNGSKGSTESGVSSNNSNLSLQSKTTDISRVSNAPKQPMIDEELKIVDGYTTDHMVTVPTVDDNGQTIAPGNTMGKKKICRTYGKILISLMFVGIVMVGLMYTTHYLLLSSMRMYATWRLNVNDGFMFFLFPCMTIGYYLSFYLQTSSIRLSFSIFFMVPSIVIQYTSIHLIQWTRHESLDVDFIDLSSSTSANQILLVVTCFTIVFSCFGIWLLFDSNTISRNALHQELRKSKKREVGLEEKIASHEANISVLTANISVLTRVLDDVIPRENEFKEQIRQMHQHLGEQAVMSQLLENSDDRK